MGSTMAAYFSEVGYQDNPQNFFEVAVPAGTDVSGYSIAIYNGSGVLKGTMAFPAPDATLLGHDVYSFDEFTPGGVQYGASEAIALIDDTGTVVQFVSFEENRYAVNRPGRGRNKHKSRFSELWTNVRDH